MNQELNSLARERAMDKIRKLLAMANDGRGNENEAANAASQAEKLMRHYQIDAAETTLKEIEQDEAFGQEAEGVSFEGLKGYKPKQAPSWVGVIAIGCGEAFTCKVDLVGSPDGLKVRFSGYQMDVQLCRWVYHFLCETVFRLSKEQMGGIGMSAAKSFRAGAAGVLQGKLYAMKAERDKDLHSAPTGTGLILYDRKEERVQEMYGATPKKRTNTKVGDNAAFHAGREAGSKINIPSNRPLTSNDARRLQ